MLPHDHKAEERIIGAIMIEPATLGQVLWLDPNDFYSEKHRAIWQAIQETSEAGHTPDITTVTGQLNGHASDADIAAIVGRAEYPAIFNVPAYAEAIAENAVRRQVIAQAREITKAAHSDSFGDLHLQVRNLYNETLDSYSTEDHLIHDPKAWSELLRREIPRLREQVNVLPWSNPALNNVANKMQPGDLIVIGARTSHGKSFLLLHEAIFQAQAGKPVLLATAENTVFQTLIRALSNVVRIDNASIFRGEWEDEAHDVIMASIEDMAAWPLQLVGHTGRRRRGRATDKPRQVTPSVIRRAVHHMEARGEPPALIVVDYLQALAPDLPTGNIRTDTIQILWSLKNLGLEFACPVLTGAQVGRQVEHRDYKVPRLVDLKESGAIEEVADTVIMLVNWEMYYSPGEIIRESHDTRVCRRGEWMIVADKERWDGKSHTAGWLKVQPEFAHIAALASRHEQEMERRLG